MSISAPPVGTNVGGLTLEEFMKGLNERFSILKETGSYRRFETFSLAARSQKQKEFLESLLEYRIIE